MGVGVAQNIGHGWLFPRSGSLWCDCFVFFLLFLGETSYVHGLEIKLVLFCEVQTDCLAKETRKQSDIVATDRQRRIFQEEISYSYARLHKRQNCPRLHRARSVSQKTKPSAVARFVRASVHRKSCHKTLYFLTIISIQIFCKEYADVYKVVN